MKLLFLGIANYSKHIYYLRKKLCGNNAIKVQNTVAFHCYLYNTILEVSISFQFINCCYSECLCLCRIRQALKMTVLTRMNLTCWNTLPSRRPIRTQTSWWCGPPRRWAASCTCIWAPRNGGTNWTPWSVMYFRTSPLTSGRFCVIMIIVILEMIIILITMIMIMIIMMMIMMMIIIIIIIIMIIIK